MPRTTIVACILFFFISNTFAQVYHYKTGKVLPVSKPGQVFWKKGVFQNYEADFGTLALLENPQNPKSELINIPVIKVKCLQPDSIKEPYFILHGGPGESNIQATLLFNALLLKHDVILIGYRGVDGSVSLQESFYKEALFSDSLNRSNKNSIFNNAANQVIQNLNEKKIEWQGFSLENVVGDIEKFRYTEGYPKISFLAFSYGTMIAQLYADQFPENVKRNILIGARPLGNFWLSDSIFHLQFFQLFLEYKKGTNDNDTLESDFTKLISQVIDSRHLKAAGMNPVMFDLFIFSQCYSFQNAMQLFKLLDKAPEKGYNELFLHYKEFFKNYPNMLLGDLLIKKMNWNSTLAEEFFANNYVTSSIIESVNSWYSPIIVKDTVKKQHKTFIKDSIPTFFVFGANDVASPYSLFQSLITTKYSIETTRILPDCSHLDLFYNKRSQLIHFVDSIASLP